MLVRKWLGKVPPHFLEIPLRDCSFPLFLPFSSPLPLSFLPNHLLFVSLLFPSSSCKFLTWGGSSPQLCPQFLEDRPPSLAGPRRSGRCQNSAAYCSHQPGSSGLIPRNLSKGEGPMAQEIPSPKTPQAAANQLVGSGDVVAFRAGRTAAP